MERTTFENKATAYGMVVIAWKLGFKHPCPRPSSFSPFRDVFQPDREQLFQLSVVDQSGEKRTLGFIGSPDLTDVRKDFRNVQDLADSMRTCETIFHHTDHGLVEYATNPIYGMSDEEIIMTLEMMRNT